MTDTPTAWLLTWNPQHFSSGGDGDEQHRLALEVGGEVRWTCSSQQPRPGDRVYLIRLGVEPKGIIASGEVTASPFMDRDWRDPARQRSFIKFRVDEFRPECADGLLPMALLQRALPAQRWSPQSSGIGIRPEGRAALEELWRRGAGRHSLAQFVDWSTEHSAENGWLESYRRMVRWIASIRAGEVELDQAALDRLWRVPQNGVTGVGPGMLSHAEFAGNQDFLKAWARDIIARPDDATLAGVMTAWEAAVKEQRFSVMRRAVIRRLFAGAAPERYTSLVQDGDCWSLLKILGEQFQLPTRSGDGWAELNQAIKQAIETAGLDSGRPVETNVALWRLVRTPKADAAAEADPQSANARESVPMTAPPLNQILYGPPGTGKTYDAVDRALEILDPAALALERPGRKDRFDELVDVGQIQFTTFHQSFSYEDFVEGVRAETVKGALEYRVEPGVFLTLCERASQGRIAANDPFDQALERFRQQLEDNDGRLTLHTVKGKAFDVEYSGGETCLVYPQSSEGLVHGYTANLNLARQLYQTGSKQGIYNTSYVEGLLLYLQKACGLPPYQPPRPRPEDADRFVLIIDEINRGNVSRIFGELITLIEPSKRAGAADALQVVLPYSKQPFSVPANLYLIGTMNTADRSLAGLDIALRRRFVFREMPPQPQLLDGVTVAGIDIGALLRCMNQRIEVLLDRDHCLGHAYFMPLEHEPRLERLAAIFRQQVLPLLQEYFFEDWQRIAWVLNDHRKPAACRFVYQLQNSLQELFGDVPVPEHSLPWHINEAAFDRVEAYLGIVDHRLAQAPADAEPERDTA